MGSSYLAIGLAVVFIAILFMLHFLKRELDPAWRMISEYEIGRFGWMMRLAFFCWGASLLALVVTLWPSLQPISGSIGRWWFVLIVIALFGAGIFKTDPITDQTSSLVNIIHTLCGTIVILTFPIAATLAVHSLLYDPSWAADQGVLIFGTVLIWVGMILYFATVIIARIKDPSAGSRGGPKVLMGWPNRFNVVTYIFWIIIVAATALRF
ncbi:MAG TPA: DUF998 domain-containing protein [Anaerolineales bacterium]|nr:DUF998 domain-containing protein [Anaerolineales bacterium]